MTQGLGAPLIRWELQLPQKGLAGWSTGRSAWEVRRDREPFTVIAVVGRIPAPRYPHPHPWNL